MLAINVDFYNMGCIPMKIPIGSAYCEHFIAIGLFENMFHIPRYGTIHFQECPFFGRENIVIFK